MGFNVVRRNSSRRRSFKRVEPRERTNETNSSRAASKTEAAAVREIGSALRKIGDQLNDSRLDLATKF